MLKTSSSAVNPFKRRRLESVYPSYESESFAALAEDRIASRAKLQTTWEDIIQRYSVISENDADEIDLETGEIIIDNGHLQSLGNSVLWEPIDSEDDDDEEIFSEPGPTLINENNHTNNDLPSEESIIAQFGDKYGKDIITFLKSKRNENGHKELWRGPDDEDIIFTRAKELWNQYQLNKPSPINSKKFDKESFEKAVFGNVHVQQATFEDLVFGEMWKLNSKWHEESEEDMDDIKSISMDKKEDITILETPPRKRLRTPSVKSTSTPSRLSAKAKEKLRGNVVSGLVVDASDEEDDFLASTSPSVRARVPQTRQITPELAKVSPHSRKVPNRRIYISDDDDDEDDNEEDHDDYVIKKGKDTGEDFCGKKGYRCTKAFCFKCTP
jgi:Centromere protein Scm3